MIAHKDAQGNLVLLPVEEPADETDPDSAAPGQQVNAQRMTFLFQFLWH